ncbi:MAG: response regulator [Elusimicrobia bacterium]|nr:response regulator [Elusimicrobiota bacterium]
MRARDAHRILIVDDERDLVEPLALRLSLLSGCVVDTAFDGDEGFRKALQIRPDVALVDLSMPELDGWGLIRRLREHPLTRPVRVVIMTAWITKDLERRALAEGVTKVLLKPFEEEELLAAISPAPAAGTDAGTHGG